MISKYLILRKTLLCPNGKLTLLQKNAFSVKTYTTIKIALYCDLVQVFLHLIWQWQYKQISLSLSMTQFIRDNLTWRTYVLRCHFLFSSPLNFNMLEYRILVAPWLTNLHVDQSQKDIIKCCLILLRFELLFTIIWYTYDKTSSELTKLLIYRKCLKNKFCMAHS